MVAVEAKPFSFSVAAFFRDIDFQQTLIYTLKGLPPGSGLILGAKDGHFHGTPTVSDFLASPMTLQLKVSDGRGGQVESTLFVVVQPGQVFDIYRDVF